ncbi:outer membrane protein [Methylopila sp. Yamaguchi]|uniref:outer membrane protein n=1 Tax=Methylopila sp. Yamaguchi TaxID=1437817 RepID=UPI000CAE6CAF|nr:outer membrane protein [Methylopila sp. Yamaguchi]GBD50650.1 outer-membrane immunogenic protein [Methylopila sp. Yamaguchi]
MIRTVIAAAAVALVAPAAFAADLPYESAPADYAAPAQGYSWSGAYLGAQAGYGWSKSKNKNAPDTKPNGGIVGAYAGYNHQFDGSPVVVGVETDFNYDDGEDRKSNGGVSVRNRKSWSGATRARVGYAFDKFLAYGAAGVAYADQKVTASDGVVAGHDSKTAVGYTVGVGAESAVTDNVTARVEYRYTDYGSDKYNIGGEKLKSSTTENRLMGGVAYKFNNLW